MEHFFRKLTERFAVKILVKLLYLRVFVARAKSHRGISLVKALDSCLTACISICRKITGLTATADASAGTGHHLNEVVVLLTALD